MNHTHLTRSSRFAALLLATALLPISTPALAATTPPMTFTFDGGGYGHGIGMSQWGAQGFATRKTDPMTYDRILAHYYQGTKLVVPSSNANPTVRVNLDSGSASRNAWRIASGSGTTLTVEAVSDTKDEILLKASSTYWIKTVSGNPGVYADTTYKDAKGVTQHKAGTLKKQFSGSHRVESIESRVTRSSGWKSVKSSSVSGGDQLTCSTVGEQVSIRFEGTSIRWIGTKGPQGGKADVYLDGVLQTADRVDPPADGAISLYSATTAYKQPLFSRDKMTSGSHTLAIKVAAPDPKYPTRKVVSVDAFDVYEGVRAFSGDRIMIVSTSGPFDYTSVRWRGNIHFAPYDSASAKAINHVSLENYLLGVVPRESPSGWNIEALKTQAVAARSYAYQDAKDGRAIWCTTMSQVYGGASHGSISHEPTSTTNAVNATKGQLVWYQTETKPVKTFFFSSSGGHTASVEDVWGSTPKEYYTGVDDADQASPNYRWTLGPISNQTLAEKIRAKVGTTLSAPSPYVPVSIVVDTASSGYVRTAAIRWSNGKTYTLRGDVMRSALSMKSSKFSPRTRAEAPSPSFVTSGTWTTSYVSGSSGGSHVKSKQAKASLQVKFRGTSISWIGAKYRGYGIGEVWFDGTKVKTVDLYSANTAYQRKLYTKSGLTPSTTHTLKIVVTGKKNSASSGYNVPVDAFDISGGGLY